MKDVPRVRESRRGQVPLLPLVRRASSGGSSSSSSRYFGEEDTAPQVRFSIWSVDAAEAVVSLTPDEALHL